MSKATVIQRNGVQFEIGERKYQVSYDPEASLGEIYDFSCDFKAHIFQVLKDRERVEAEAKAKEEKPEPKEG